MICQIYIISQLFFCTCLGVFGPVPLRGRDISAIFTEGASQY